MIRGVVGEKILAVWGSSIESTGEIHPRVDRLIDNILESGRFRRR
jgi:hypothetical protein